MTEETNVKVRLDNRQAKSQLQGLAREAARTAGKVSSKIKGTVGKGLSAIGFGGGVGAGMAAVRGATESGVGDVIGEALAPYGHKAAEAIFGDLDDDARASKSAREETIAAFGAITGARGEIPPAAREFFTNVKALRMQEEEGRGMINRDTDFFGPGVGDIIDRLSGVFKTLLTEVADYLLDKIPFVGGK